VARFLLKRCVAMTATAAVAATTRRRQDNSLALFVGLAADLTSQLASADRSQRLIDVVRQALPCDSAALLRLDGHALVCVAAYGLVPEIMSQRFSIADHPRFAQILRRRTPLRIDEPDLPDPFDGLLLSGHPLSRVHACVGAPLVVAGEVEGILAIDALDPTAFDDIDDLVIAGLATLAAAGMRTARLLDALEQDANQSEQLVRQLARDGDSHTGQILCRSEVMTAVCHDADLAARSDLAVLITGETGTGKEVVARSIHAGSDRALRPLIYVNCAALPESVAESELFGHVRGAFTGASENRSGKFEVANKGSLFLDEIGELPLSIQAKLLRALQTGEIQRVGSDQVLRVDVRIIAATNRDLHAEVQAGRFRADLFHRLSVYPIHVPPLRERVDDIVLLAGYFLDEARVRLGLGSVRLTDDARIALSAHDWPGNVRELEHTILRAALRASNGRRRETVILDSAALELTKPTRMIAGPEAVPDADVPLEVAVDDLKRRRITAAIASCNGNWASAARQLGLDRGNLHRLAKRLGMRA
jgi:anaerobic nitric oxide reductase transcription regulator